MSIPPPGPGSFAAGGLGIGTALVWVLYLLLSLTDGQARLDERLRAIERRLARPVAQKANPVSAHNANGAGVSGNLGFQAVGRQEKKEEPEEW